MSRQGTTGKWLPIFSGNTLMIWQCSECGYKVDLEDGGMYEFCSSCGAKMETREVNMDNKVLEIVRQHICERLDKSDPETTFEVYMVWKAKILQNWKYLISSTLHDGMYYELTYNGDKREWYLDAYKKFENRVIVE